jgi:cell fate regulator YaaT (PSP1 superfamily)
MTKKKAMSKVVAIRFQPLGKLYYFTASEVPDLQVGDYVIVTTTRGRELGVVIDFVSDKSLSSNVDLKPIERRATPQELVVHRTFQKRELEVLVDCREKAAELGVSGIKFADAKFSFDGSRLTFFYSVEGDEKVDLSKLRKRLQRSHRKSRVELRQVGPRDVAKIMRGMGACGMEERCCAKFITEFSPISIRMAKAQGISLNPQEITGLCGRLRCCLLYEHDLYIKAREHLPKRNKRVITPAGEGKVVEVLPLKQAVIVLLDGERKIEFGKDEIQPYEEQKALKEKIDKPGVHRKDGGSDSDRE